MGYIAVLCVKIHAWKYKTVVKSLLVAQVHLFAEKHKDTLSKVTCEENCENFSLPASGS